MEERMIQVKNASFRYGDKAVFTNLNFDIERGSIYCIVGPNGCGKTTLLDCMLGLLKVEQGDILINQTSITEIKPRELAEQVAYIPQLHQRAFPYRVKEIVLMGRAHKTALFSSPSKEDERIAEQAMERVGILQLADKPYTQISGGQCQLVMIARALAQQPNIIIMDEPTAHLDFKNELILLETVVDLVKNHHMTIVMATHFPNHAFYMETNKLPTKLALMNNGVFEQIGSPQKVLNEENIKSIYGIRAKVLNQCLDPNTWIRQIVPLATMNKPEQSSNGGA